MEILIKIFILKLLRFLFKFTDILFGEEQPVRLVLVLVRTDAKMGNFFIVESITCSIIKLLLHDPNSNIIKLFSSLGTSQKIRLNFSERSHILLEIMNS